jgi:hypothetical protein
LDIKIKLKGAFDLLFLFGRGISAFSGTKRAALQSLAVPAILFPLTWPLVYFYPPKGLETGYPYSQILTTVVLQAVLSLALSMVLVVALARAFNRLDKFWLFLEACNWTALAAFSVHMPLLLAAACGWIPRAEMDRIFVIAQCYFYVVTGCIVFRAFQLNWQLAGFITVAILFADQTAWDLLFRLQGIPLPW